MLSIIIKISIAHAEIVPYHQRPLATLFRSRFTHFADTLQHVPNSRHVAIMYQGYFYVFDVVDSSGHRLSAVEVEKFDSTTEIFPNDHAMARQLLRIVNDRKTAPPPGPAGTFIAFALNDTQFGV